MDRGGLRGRQQLQQPLVVTVGVIMGAAVLVMYLLVSRHLASIEEIALALTESIAEHTTNEANDVKALVAALENHTHTVSASVSDHVALHTLQLQFIASELRNHSAFVRHRCRAVAAGGELGSSSAAQQIKSLVEELRSRVVAAGAGTVPAIPGQGMAGAGMVATTSPANNVTLLLAAGLRLQRRMQDELEQLLLLVRLISEKQGASASAEDSDAGMREILLALKKQNAATRALQDTVEGLTEKFETQAQERSSDESAKDEKILSVLRALVAYLRAKERKPEDEDENQARMQAVLTAVLSEVRNKTAFISLLKTVRTQTTIMSRLGNRIGGLEAKVMLAASSSSNAAAAAGGEATELPTGTSAALQVLTKEVQKQSEAVAELQAAVDMVKGGGGGDVSEAVAAARKTQDGVTLLLAAVQEQAKAVKRIDQRMAVLEAKLRVLAGEKPAEAEAAAAAVDGGSGSSASAALQAVEEAMKKAGEEEEAPKGTQGRLADGAAWQQHTFAGTESFTRFSGYRAGSRRILALGLGATATQETRTATDCKWRGREATLPCTAELSFGLSRRSNFDVTVVTATFDVDVPSNGGFLSVNIDGQDFALYREEIGEYRNLEPGPKFGVQVAACVSPDLPGFVAPHSVREFVEFHRLVGVGRFVLYDSGMWDGAAMASHFAEEVKKGIVELTDFGGIAAYKMPRNGDVLAMYDCTYRHTYVADWVLAVELNEYVWVHKPPSGMLPAFLDGYREAPWVSLGSLWWSVQKCCPDFPAGDGAVDKFTMERMVFHWPGVLCHDQLAYPQREMCLGATGYRKLLMRPRMVIALGTHYAVASDGKGVDVTTYDAVVCHFQNFFKNSSAWCTDELPNDQPIEWWARDFSFQQQLQTLRSSLKCDFSKGACTN